MRAYPAYGSAFARQIARGNHPLAIGVLFSDYWRDFRDVPRVCIKPGEWALGRWEFGFMRGQHVVAIFGTGAGARAFNELVCELMLAAPRLVWIANEGGGFAEKTGDSFLHAEYARAAGVDAALVARAARVYEKAQLRELEREQAYLARGRILQRHLDIVERMFGDPLYAAADRAA